MNSEVRKWMPLEPAVRFPNQSEEASQNKTEKEEEETERCKRPRTTLESEWGVEEFVALLDRIEETKKLLKRKNMNFSGISAGGGIHYAVEGDQMLVAPPLLQKPQASSDAYNKSSTSPWKPSFQWEDFNVSNSLSAQTDLGGAAATEKRIQKGNNLLKTRSFLDGVTPAAECSHDHEEDKEGPPELGLQLFPCL